MNMDLSSPRTLDEADFRRLGLSRQECRLDVIRHAAARRAAVLVQRQLQSPSPHDPDQLSRLATSTYRVLDPRQRRKLSQRVHIGRIQTPEQLDEDIPRFQQLPVDLSGGEPLPAGTRARRMVPGIRRARTRWGLALLLAGLVATTVALATGAPAGVETQHRTGAADPHQRPAVAVPR